MKPGYKTTEFWATVALSVAPHFSSLAEAAGPATMLWYQAALAAAYVISRGVAKMPVHDDEQPVASTPPPEKMASDR